LPDELIEPGLPNFAGAVRGGVNTAIFAGSGSVKLHNALDDQDGRLHPNLCPQSDRTFACFFWPLLHVAQHFRSYADYERTDLIVIHDEPRGEQPYVNQFGIKGNTCFTLEELFRAPCLRHVKFSIIYEG